MHDDLLRRLCLAVLVLAGVLGIAFPPWETGGLGLMDAALLAGGEFAAQARHQRFVLDLVGVGLVLSAFWPALRAAAIGAAVLSKFVYLGLAWSSAQPLPSLWLEGAVVLALLAVALVLGRQALREARWEGLSTLRGQG
ncbi:hypothetical protein [Ramlibacter sp.]|uniref:hypothetical protein n=1 Tax=Ramlibacter sp. TaxID=1917967 RepID=UPI0017BD6BA6|nr:hypothetical protein [Ramlibacter sp.]MBA2675717.1 hypothetical protein [Ramlibacter sp.]